MQRALDKVVEEPGTEHYWVFGHRLPDNSEQYSYHRQKLIEMGVVRELRYRLKNVSARSCASRRLTRTLSSPTRPQCIDLEAPKLTKDEPMELTVWCYATDVSAWDRWIAEHDVPATIQGSDSTEKE